MARVLVVDDNPAGRELLAVVLRGAGHEVLLASDGDEGLQVYRTHRPELVILDVFMPRKDGIETIRELRREPGPVKIIATSAGWNVRNLDIVGSAADWDVLRHAKEVGADVTMTKPIDVDALVQKVAGLLASRP